MPRSIGWGLGKSWAIWVQNGKSSPLGLEALFNPFPPPGISPPHALLARDRPVAPQAAPVVAR